VIELRWLKGNWEWGKYKLQFRDLACREESNVCQTTNDFNYLFPAHKHSFGTWEDVPTVEEPEPKKELWLLLRDKAICDFENWSWGDQEWQDLARIAEDFYTKKGETK